MRIVRTSLLFAVIGSLCHAQPRESHLLTWGGGPLDSHADHDCVSDADRARIDAARAEFLSFVGTGTV